MRRRLILLILLAFGLLAPVTATAARPPAAKVGEPEVRWVRLGVVTPAPGEASPLAGRVVVRVLVQHRGLVDAAVGTQTVGSLTVVL
jgi:hypothetical protein